MHVVKVLFNQHCDVPSIAEAAQSLQEGWSYESTRPRLRVQHRPQSCCWYPILIQTYIFILDKVSPHRWMLQELVLLSKGKKPPADPSSYWPICLLDTTERILERIIANQIEEVSEGDRGLPVKFPEDPHCENGYRR